jgi:WD40 repeat protein
LLLALAARNGNLLILLTLLTGDVLGQVRMKQPIRALGWSPADTLLAVAAGSSISVFPATTERFRGSPRRMTEDAPGTDAVGFSSDGRLLASHDAQGLKVWDVEAGRLITRQSSVSMIAFHPSKPLLAAANGTALRILDLSGLG